MAAAWGLALFCVALVIAGLYILNVSIFETALAKTFKHAAFLSAIFIGLRIARRFGRLEVFFHIILLTYIFTVLTVILSYLAAMCGQPLVDPKLSVFDSILGLDWSGYNSWASRHGSINQLLESAYDSFLPQVVLLNVWLVWKYRFNAAWQLLLISVITCLACILLSAFWPAAGAFSYYTIATKAPYLVEFRNAHAGAMTIIGKTPVAGIITFPSFHAAMAIIYIHAARGMEEISAIFLVLNLAMLAAVPLVGGHYFADVIAGIILALAVIFVVGGEKRFWLSDYFGGGAKVTGR